MGPFGAKGVGEPSMVSIAPAVANAVCDALGVRVFDLPLTPEKIVKALKSIWTILSKVKEKEIAGFVFIGLGIHSPHLRINSLVESFAFSTIMSDSKGEQLVQSVMRLAKSRSTVNPAHMKEMRRFF